MQRKVLDYLYNQGGLTLVAFPGETEIDFEALQKFGTAPISTDDLFLKPLGEKLINELTQLDDGCGYITPKIGHVPEDENSFRNFFHNIEQIKKKIPHVIAVLPTDEINGGCDRILSICRLLILSANSAATASSYLADAKNIGKCAILWDVPEKPDKKRHPTIAKAVKRSPFKLKKLKGCRFAKEPEKFVHTVSNLHKISILKKNPIDGIPKIFLVLFPLFLLIAFMLPFAKITKVTATISNERNRIQERNSLTVAPSSAALISRCRSDQSEERIRTSPFASRPTPLPSWGRKNCLGSSPSLYFL